MTSFMNNRTMVPTHDQGILDFAPGAAAAFSLRNLSYTYTGPVVTVRRSTDNAEADFTARAVSDNTLAAWCGGGDGFVKTWHDQSQHGRDATQTTTTYQPKIVASGVLVTEGGKAAVQFDGVNDLMTIAGEITLGGDFSIFGLFTRPTSTVQYVFRKGNGTYSTRLGATSVSGSIEIFVRSVSGQASVNTQAAGNLHAITAQRAGSLALYVDGAASGTASMASVDSSNSPLGEQGLGGQASGAFFYNGKMQELIIYPADMTASRQRIEANLAWYY